MTVFSKTSILALSVCAAALTACSTPNSLPDGYTHHNKPYKSQVPSQSGQFTTAQRQTMGPQQADQFRLAVYQLVDSLTERAGMPPKNIYVAKPEPMTAFYANMDNDIRESMRHVGYTLTDSPVDAYVFTYAATPLPNPAAGAPNVHLAIHVYDGIGKDGKLLTSEEGDFFIQGAEKLQVPFAAFPEVVPGFLPQPTGGPENIRQ